MRINREVTSGNAVYEVVSDYLWQVFLVRLTMVTVAAYTYSQNKISLITSLLICASSLMLRTYKSEDLLIIDGLGVQTSQYGLIKHLSDHSTFYPKSVIQACVINEIFEGFRVNYVIQIIKENSDEVSQVFPTMRPGIVVLREIWLRLSQI